jgi:hypothetical protein
LLTSDQSSRHTIEVMNGQHTENNFAEDNMTERPMNANSLPWPGQGRPLPDRYSGVAQAAFT